MRLTRCIFSRLLMHYINGVTFVENNFVIVGVIVFAVVVVKHSPKSHGQHIHVHVTVAVVIVHVVVCIFGILEL